MTTPDVSDISDYGVPDGGFVDAEGVAPVDPTSDQSGAAASAAFCDTAQMTHTARRAWARFTAGTSPTLAAVNGHDAMWGSSSGAAPVPAHSATGVYTMTWPVAVDDELGASHNVNLRFPEKPNVEGATLYFAQATMTAPNVMTIYVFNSSGVANDATGVVISVGAS